MDNVLDAFERYYFDNITKMVAEEFTSVWTSHERLLSGYDNYCKYASWRLVQIIKHLPADMSGKNILDITCFATTQIVKLAHPNAHVYSCDKQLLWQRFLSDDIHCARVDLIHDEFPYESDFFDAIVFTEVLEHIPRSPYEVLLEVKRILRPGGILLISVPNLLWLVQRLKMMTGRSPLSVGVADPANVNSADPEIARSASTYGHFREYSASELEDILRGVGFEVGSITFPHWYPRKFRSQFRQRSLLKNIVAGGYLAMDAINPRWRTTVVGVATKPVQ